MYVGECTRACGWCVTVYVRSRSCVSMYVYVHLYVDLFVGVCSRCGHRRVSI